MTATYTFDVFCTLDGYGSYDQSGDRGGPWGKQGPECLARRLAVVSEEQRMVLGVLPTTVVSTTLEEPLVWPDATLASADA
jgi:hypothetical protein